MKFTIVLIILAFAAVDSIAETADSATLLEQGALHYQNRDDDAHLQKAVESFEQALQLDPQNYEAGWRLSQAYWYQGNFNGADSKKQYFDKGIAAGKIAVDANPSGCKGHFWLGVNYALYAEQSGILEAYALIDKVKEEMKKALEIDKLCECGGPQRVLGKLYSRIPFFKGGSKDKAIEYLNESLDLCPQDTQSRIFLAEVYLDERKKGLAIQQLKLVLKQEPDPEWLPETRVNKQVAEHMLSELENSKKK
jgi:tetratricopeptide (TPR) repeat protein